MLTTALILSGWFALLFIWEGFAPLRQPRVALAHRLFVNLTISALAVATAAALAQPASVRALGLPAAAQAVVGFLLHDLTYFFVIPEFAA